MPIKSGLIGILVLLLAVFAGLNWPAVMAPAPLSLGVTEVQAPLGLVLLIFTAVLCVLFVTFLLVLQATALMESRRMAKALHTQQELADKAEASRFTQLGAQVETQIQNASRQHEAELAQIQEQLNQLETNWNTALNESTASISACIGEVEDKLDRTLQAVKP